MNKYTWIDGSVLQAKQLYKLDYFEFMGKDFFPSLPVVKLCSGRIKKLIYP